MTLILAPKLFSMTLMQHSPKLITTPNIKLYQLKWFLSIFARPIKIHQFHIVSLYPWSLCQVLFTGDWSASISCAMNAAGSKYGPWISEVPQPNLGSDIKLRLFCVPPVGMGGASFHPWATWTYGQKKNPMRLERKS